MSRREEVLAQMPGVRTEVLAFALLMEGKLRRNDYKGTTGWKDDHVFMLEPRVREEAMELRDVIRDHKVGTLAGALEAIVRGAKLEEGEDRSVRQLIGEEAADVANMAMMVADVCGCLNLNSLDGM